MQSMRIGGRGVLALAVCASLALTACEKDGEKKVVSQVAAKVDGQEITVHRINFALSSVPNLRPEQSKEATSQILDKLIDQEVLVQKAVEKKLDRDPHTMLAIEESKRQILAQAYLQSRADALPSPAADEVKAFYGQHPELFSQRRVYRLQELTLAGKPEVEEKLKAAVAKAKSINDVALWLRDQHIGFNANAVTMVPEQVSLDMATQLQQMKAGSLAVLPGAGVLRVVSVLDAQPAAIDEKQAGPIIEQFLRNRARIAALEQEVKQLRAAAKIEYVGEFAKQAAGTPAKSPAPEAKAPQAATSAATAPKTEVKADAGFMDKGLSGLK